MLGVTKAMSTFLTILLNLQLMGEYYPASWMTYVSPATSGKQERYINKNIQRLNELELDCVALLLIRPPTALSKNLQIQPSMCSFNSTRIW